MQSKLLALLHTYILFQVAYPVSCFSLFASIPRRHILLAMTSAATTSTTKDSQSYYWNRETSQAEQYSASKPIIKQARIICLSDLNDKNNDLLYNGSKLPEGSKVLSVGTSMDYFDLEMLKKEKANVIFVSHAKVGAYVLYIAQQ